MLSMFKAVLIVFPVEAAKVKNLSRNFFTHFGYLRPIGLNLPQGNTSRRY